MKKDSILNHCWCALKPEHKMLLKVAGAECNNSNIYKHSHTNQKNLRRQCNLDDEMLNRYNMNAFFYFFWSSADDVVKNETKTFGFQPLKLVIPKKSSL